MIYDLSNTVDTKRAKLKFDQLIEDKKTINLSLKQKSRSISQNAYLHVCISLFAIEFGYSLDEAKTLLKGECHFMNYEKNDFRFLKQTRDMDTIELTSFIEWIRDYSAKQSCYIPTPEEYITNQFEIDREIQRNKSHL